MALEKTSDEALTMIKSMKRDEATNKNIAIALNEKGLKTARGNKWDENRVAAIYFRLGTAKAKTAKVTKKKVNRTPKAKVNNEVMVLDHILEHGDAQRVELAKVVLSGKSLNNGERRAIARALLG